VLAAAWLFLHPERYNLEFPKLDGAPAAITLKNAASIDELTVCMGQHGNANGWFRTLRNLNPAYEPHQQLPIDTRLEVPAKLVAVYEKSCVTGKWATLASELQAAALPAAPAKPVPRYYVVRKGETLTGVVRRFNCTSSRELASLNHLKAPHYPLHTGQTLQLPECVKR
jgi:membrane-bound lytic murein transglycosylase D